MKAFRSWLATTKFLVSAFAFTVSFGAASAGDANVLARVGEIEIKADEVRTVLETLEPGARAALASDPSLLNQLVRSLLARRLVLQEAAAKRWEQRADVIAQIEQARQSAIIDNYLQSISEPPETYPSEAEVRSAYETNKPALFVPRKFRLAQIFIALPKTADKGAADAAQAKLDRVKKNVRAPGADFAAIARMESEEKISASRGGEIGWLTEAQVQPEIRPKVVGLTKNAISEPVQLADGWHILKALEISEADTPSFEVVRKQLAEELRAQRAKADRQAYLTTLLKENPAAINELALGEVLAPVPPRPFKANFK